MPCCFRRTLPRRSQLVEEKYKIVLCGALGALLSFNRYVKQTGPLKSMTIKNFHQEIQLTRRILTPSVIKNGYSYWLGSKRAIRISPGAQPDSLFLVKAASERANFPNARGPFSGNFAELLAIVDQEVSIILAEMPKRTLIATSLVHSTCTKSAALRPMARESIKDFVFEPSKSELTDTKGLIYRWEIYDGDTCVGVYIGLTHSENSEERISRYRARVMGLQRGEPYSKKNPGGYRKVHRALEAGLHAGHRIVLTHLSGHQPGLTLKRLETQYILEHDSYGPAQHQLNEAK